ncbi:MAG: acyltransferase, partial [Verrucomicrobia bacterium]|nr:acyltransferase [Verrucomicrobiota bacterium]
MSSPAPSSYRPDIDGLRGIAVLMVVLFHAHISFRGGYIGVDIFFVISGYLITLLMMRDLEADTFSLADFWERRFRRIFPALAIMILVTVGLGFMVLLPEALINLADSLQAQTVFLSNLFFWNDSGDYFAGPAEEKALLHTWSLAVEEQFYIVMPLLCLLIRWKWKSRSHGLSLRELSFRVFNALLILSFILAVAVTWIDAHTAFYWLPTRTWELMMGSSLACLPIGKWHLNDKPRVIISWIALLTILIVGWVYNKRTIFPGLAAAPPCLATAFLIWAGHPNFAQTKVSKLLGSKALVRIGLASYSFYLWHWPILAFMNYLNPGHTDNISKSIRVGLMLIVFLVAL